MTRTIAIAEGVPPNGYPLVMGHNGLRGEKGDERGAPLALVPRISNLGGMFGLGTANTTPREFIKNYKAVLTEMGGRAVAIGTDVNGFERLPRHERPSTEHESTAFYGNFLSELGIM